MSLHRTPCALVLYCACSSGVPNAFLVRKKNSDLCLETFLLALLPSGQTRPNLVPVPDTWFAPINVSTLWSLAILGSCDLLVAGNPGIM